MTRGLHAVHLCHLYPTHRAICNCRTSSHVCCGLQSMLPPHQYCGRPYCTHRLLPHTTRSMVMLGSLPLPGWRRRSFAWGGRGTVDQQCVQKQRQWQLPNSRVLCCPPPHQDHIQWCLSSLLHHHPSPVLYCPSTLSPKVSLSCRHHILICPL